MMARREQEEMLTRQLMLLQEKERILQENKEKARAEKVQVTDDKPKQKQPEIKEEKSSVLGETIGLKSKIEPTMMKLGMPKISTFSGRYFEQWRREVTCLSKSGLYHDYAISQAIRHSLQGDARDVLLTLKMEATTEQIIKKLEEIYGNVRTGENLVKDFYSATQREKESCSAWGVRIEALFQRAVETGELEEARRDSKLKERFWRGLKSEKLKMSTRVSCESKDSFDTLRRKARMEEEDMRESSDGKPATYSATSQQQTDMLKELLDRMKTLESEMNRMKERKEPSYSGNYEGGYGRGGRYSRGGNRRNYDRDNNQSDRQNSDRSDKQAKPQEKTTEDRPSGKKHLNDQTLPPKGTMEAKKEENAQKN